MKTISSFVLGLVIGSALTFLVLKVHESPRAAPETGSNAIKTRESSSSSPPASSATIQSATSTGLTSDSTKTSEETPKTSSTPSAEHLDPALARLFQEEPASKRHPQLLKEPRDSNWAPAMEDQWRQYYAGKPELLAYGAPEITCGSTLCEIRLVTSGSKSDAEWVNLMTGTGANPMPITRLGGAGVAHENGVTAIAIYFRRAKDSTP